MMTHGLILVLVGATVLLACLGCRRGPAARRLPGFNQASVVQQRRRIRATAGGVRRCCTSASRIRPGDVANWCDDLARRVRAGTSLSQAIGESVPSDAGVRNATAPIRLAIERGRSVADAVSSIDLDHPSAPGLHHVGTACSVVAVSARLGGASAAPLDRVAAALRLREVDDQERASHSAQARMSAHVLTVVPIGMLIVLVAADPDIRTTIVEPVGAACIALGLTLNVSGWLWMRHTIGTRR